MQGIRYRALCGETSSYNSLSLLGFTCRDLSSAFPCARAAPAFLSLARPDAIDVSCSNSCVENLTTSYTAAERQEGKRKRRDGKYMCSFKIISKEVAMQRKFIRVIIHPNSSSRNQNELKLHGASYLFCSYEGEEQITSCGTPFR